MWYVGNFWKSFYLHGIGKILYPKQHKKHNFCCFFQHPEVVIRYNFNIIITTQESLHHMIPFVYFVYIYHIKDWGFEYNKSNMYRCT